MKLLIKEPSLTISAAIEKLIYDNNLNTTKPVTGSGYILSNGDFVDLDSHGFRTHASFDDYIVNNHITTYKDARGLLFPIKYCNAIRCNDGKNFMGEVILDLPPNPCTEAQYESIEKWLDSIVASLVSVSVSDSDSIADYDLNLVDSSYIIKRIKAYYKSGRLVEALLTESDQEEPDDFHTGNVTNDNIFDSKTHVAFYDQLFTNPDYMKEKHNLVGHIEQMSPNEYYKECSKYVFDNTPVEQIKISRRANPYSLDKIKSLITKYKRRVFLPYINYAQKGQEGLHRMMVAGDLFGWDHKFPVLVINWYDKKRAEADARAKELEKFERAITQALSKSGSYSYKDFDEFKSEMIDYLLDAQLRYFDGYPFDIDIYIEGQNAVIDIKDIIKYKFNPAFIKYKPKDDVEDAFIADIDFNNYQFSEEELADIDNLSPEEFIKKYG